MENSSEQCPCILMRLFGEKMKSWSMRLGAQFFLDSVLEKQKIALASGFSNGGKGFVVELPEESKRNPQTNQTHKSLHKYFVCTHSIVLGLENQLKLQLWWQFLMRSQTNAV